MKIDVKAIERILEYTFKDKKLLEKAFTHSSFANENHIECNERLEFLGDSVLSLVISTKLFFDSKEREGGLSRLRARIVSEKPLALIVESFNLDKFLLKGEGESKVETTCSMKADLLEAIIGAIYIDSGIEEAKKFVLRFFEDVIVEMETTTEEKDYKTQLQEKLSHAKIKYVAEKSGPPHMPIFNVLVYVNKVICGKGTGKTKRDAEQMAAGDALKCLKEK